MNTATLDTVRAIRAWTPRVREIAASVQRNLAILRADAGIQAYWQGYADQLAYAAPVAGRASR